MAHSNESGSSDIPSFRSRLSFFEGQTDSSCNPNPTRRQRPERTLSKLFCDSSLNETETNIPGSTSVTSLNSRRGTEQVRLKISGGVEESRADEEDKNQDNGGGGEDMLKSLLALALLKGAVDSASRTKSM